MFSLIFRPWSKKRGGEGIIIFFIICFSVKEFSDTVESARCNDFDLKLLKKMIQALWERSRKKVMGKEYTPSAVIYIDANSGPDRIVPHLGHATATKVGINTHVGLSEVRVLPVWRCRRAAWQT